MEKVRKILGSPFKAAGAIVLIIGGLWAFVLELAIVNAVAGFWAVVFAFAIAPVTFVAAPWYAGVAWGNWFPLFVGYGSMIGGGLLFSLGSRISGDN